MWLNWLRNISFRRKMTLIFTIVCAFSTGIAGILYYGYAEREIINNFTANASSLVNQMENILDARLEAVDRRAFAALTNSSFTQPLGDYLSRPDTKKEVALRGEAANWLKDIRQAEPFVHSAFLWTDKGLFDDYTMARNWDFRFEDSPFCGYFQDPASDAIQWLPAMKDQVFRGDAAVLPYVRRFTIPGYRQSPSYLIIQLDQKALMEETAGSGSLGEVVIADMKGNVIAGTTTVNEEALTALSEAKSWPLEEWGSRDMEWNGEDYLVCRGVVDINHWQIYILKSKKELLDSIRRLQWLILGLTAALIFGCMLLVAVLSRQMTGSLKRLAKQMNRVRGGEMDARYYYPYRDEVGSLTKSFNYMADEIEKAMKMQQEYIEILKQERDLMEQMQEQKRKAEFRALQAQINPHFLYNTLNTITWMASDKGVDEIRILSNSLGKFFRISLSRGAEIISVADELEHIKSYLAIQMIRYAQKLNYEICVPESLLSCRILKLVLQPLVENSIYHGIKEKEGMGRILVGAKLCDEGQGREVIRFWVEDNGMGFTAEKLAKINESLQKGDADSGDGYGIFNVNERIRLYYGQEYGLSYESIEGQWTRAVLTVPAQPFVSGNGGGLHV